MKKLQTTFLAILISTFAFGQNLDKLNAFLDVRIKENKENADTSFYNLVGKKYYYFKKSADGQNEIRKILEFKENNEIQLIDVLENLKTGDIITHIYTGDAIRNKSYVSIYANKENSKKISMPHTFNLILQIVDKIWYLIDFTSNENWKEGKTVISSNNTITEIKKQ